MPRTSLGLVLAILAILALAPAVSAAALAPVGAAAHTASSDHDDPDDTHDDRSGPGHDDRSGPGHGDRDEDDDSDDDCSRPRDEDDDDAVVISGPIPTGTTVIDIFDDDCFTPDEVTIDLGGSVTFVNHHSDEHTATGSAFDTGRIDTGQTATVTLDTPGTYAFACVIHPEMTGTISVRDASGVVPSPTPAASAPPAPAALTAVAIVDFAFEPTQSVVAVGTTVGWTVTQQSPHTVTAADGSFDSDILDVGGTFRHTFLEPGSFAYACRLHPQMQATIVVDPSLPAVSPIPGASAGPSPSAGP